jgi:predicted N-acetyltransferase YhbS
MEAGALTLRDATPSDAEIIYQVTKAAFDEYRAFLDPPSGVSREALESVQDFLREGGAILALTGGAAVGVVRYERREDDALYVGRLAVLPSHRKRGIGRALMAAAEDKARRMGLSRLTLGVRIQLPKSRTFYESLGCGVNARGSHPGYDRPTWLHMTKTLET